MADAGHRLPTSTRLTDAERLDLLRLSRTERVGPITFRSLLDRFGTAAEALAALPELARRGGRSRALTPYPTAEAEREMAALAKLGARLLAVTEPDYPALLAAIPDSPPLLAVRGDASLLGRSSVAVVGARNASANGRRFARMIADDLGKAGWVVVSGLARGIDTAAHEAALGRGTVAVMAGGIDIVYPPENARLYDALVERGAVVTEAAFGAQPQARHFPRRNRLISGLSMGVVVVEAARRSGSLITARLAAEQGREVFAVPGSPLDARAEGCNDLIRGGATLVASAADVIEGLTGMAGRPRAPRQGDMLHAPMPHAGAEAAGDDARAIVLNNLTPAPTPVDELVRACQLSAAVVMTVLLEFELAGRVERRPGNQVCLI